MLVFTIYMTADDFKREVFPLKDKIYRFAKRLLGMNADAEDATQDVFVKLWNNKQQLTAIGSVEAFAMTVTKNTCLDKMKTKRVRIVELPTDGINGKLHTQYEPELANRKKIVEQIIGRLPELQKMIVQLREIEGFEFTQIAAVTGATENTIRVNLSRARKTIKEELGKIDGYGLKRGTAVTGEVL